MKNIIMPGLLPVVCLHRIHVQCLKEIIFKKSVLHEQTKFFKGSNLVFSKSINYSVIPRLQFSPGQFLTSPPPEKVRWSGRWPATGLPPLQHTSPQLWSPHTDN